MNKQERKLKGQAKFKKRLKNYGIDELRFTKPVYPGSEMHIRFTCKEKIRQEKKEPTDIDKGIVKWLVEMIDETNELTGIATILTMVAKKPVQ